MKIKAICSFAGTVSMCPNEVLEVNDELASDLICAGYVQQVESDKPKKAVKPNGNKRNKR